MRDLGYTLTDSPLYSSCTTQYLSHSSIEFIESSFPHHRQSRAGYRLQSVQSASKKVAVNMTVHRAPQRLIYCVDGTWCGPDGSRPLPTGTLTNIYQIYASIHDSSKNDEAVDGFFQKPVYMHGIGSADDTHSLSRLTAGVFGEGHLSQIRKIYEECCKLGPEDEVWLFGFSRGAFVVRAVAGLLHYMRALSSAGTSQFNEDYKRSLDIYQSMQRNGNLGKGRVCIMHYFLGQHVLELTI